MRNQNWSASSRPRSAAFLVSGALIDNNLIMYDVETQTTWPQLLAMANLGPREGECLEFGRNTVATTWNFWRRLHPETLVLSNQNQNLTAIQPDFYKTNPYLDYHEGVIDPPHAVSYPDSRRPPQEIVLGVHAKDGKAAVILTKPVSWATIGNTPAVFFHDPGTNTSFAFENNLGGVTRLWSSYDPDEKGLPRFQDDGGTVWSMDGIGLEGPLAGQRLAQLPSLALYWFAWATFFPDQPIISPQG